MTSRAKQLQVGVSEPVYGFLAAAHAVDLGAPVRLGELIAPHAEPEIVFTLGRDLAGPHVTAADVLAATASVAVGIEIIDFRYRDYRFTMADVAADNTSAGRYVVGSPVSPNGIDLRLVGVVLERNGDVVATASGSASLGQPGRGRRLAGAGARGGRRWAAGRRGRALRRADRRRAGGTRRRRRRLDRPARHRRAGLCLRGEPCR